MKILILPTFASILLLSGCAGSPHNQMSTETSAETSPTSSVFDYRCESGETIATTYPTTDSATIRYKGSYHQMQIAVSGSGSRYVDGKFEWWTKGSGPGSEGTLFRHKTDGTSGEIIEVCTQS